MLNPNSRANTVISQSFIASQFQGYNDPYTNTQPTSSLNQFVKSKQTSDSGFIQDGQNHSFGFSNITANHQPTKLQSLSRKTNQTVPVNVNMPRQPPQNNQPNQPNNTPQFQQQAPNNQRYISPGMVKTDTPNRPNQFPNQNNTNFNNQQNNPNLNPQMNNVNNFVPPNQFQNQSLNNQPQGQGQNFQFVNQSINQNRPPQYPTTQQQSNQQSIQLPQNSTTQFSNQPTRPNLQNNQTPNNRPPSTQPPKQFTTSNVGQRLKLNISQQFSNSFTLDCVTEPQRSNILEMKRRQREYRKSIQNFFI